ncbi:MAG: NAD(P)H-binding protein [Alcanivoracaceae bacterium]|nr:NAD(P)H-binding protein [Alcanivoracaceae bacterium]
MLGATGLTGRNCLNFLLDDKAYEKVITLCRRPIHENGKELTHEKLEQHIVNFDSLESHSDLFKVDDVFCCLGTTIKKAGSKAAFRKVDLEYAVAAAKIAAANHCQQFLVISAPESGKKSPFFYGRVKAEMEERVGEESFAGTYIFRPSLLIGEREEGWRPGEGLAIQVLTRVPWLMVGGLKKLKPIDARDVARAMVIVAKTQPQGHRTFSSDRIQAIADAGAMPFPEDDTRTA